MIFLMGETHKNKAIYVTVSHQRARRSGVRNRERPRGEVVS
jgi:hypothetical protein